MATTVTVKQLIADQLKVTCKAVTGKLREKEDKKNKKRKFSREEVLDVEACHRAIGWDEAKVAHIMKAFSILLGAPELKAGTAIKPEVFSVIVLGHNASGSPFTVGEPFIATQRNTEVSYYCLALTGEPTRFVFNAPDRPRFATDEEIDKCIDNLNDAQWYSIKTNAVFVPILDAAFSRSISVESVSGGPDEDDEPLLTAAVGEED